MRDPPNGARVVIDGTNALRIGHGICEVLEDFQKLAPCKDIKVELKRMESRLAPAKR